MYQLSRKTIHFYYEIRHRKKHFVVLYFNLFINNKE
jgi:hypothetical protein